MNGPASGKNGRTVRGLVVLDMDKVIIRGQSQLLLLRYLYRERYVSLIPPLKIFGWYCLYKVGLLRDPETIASYAFSFLRGWETEKVRRIFSDFFRRELVKSVFPEIRPIIAGHRRENHEIMIISSACDLVVADTAAFLGIDEYEASVLERKNGLYTGRLDGNLVYGREKARRFRARGHEGPSWAYADHFSDLPLLEAVDHPVAVNPCRRLRRAAAAGKWPVLVFASTAERRPPRGRLRARTGRRGRKG